MANFNVVGMGGDGANTNTIGAGSKQFTDVVGGIQKARIGFHSICANSEPPSPSRYQPFQILMLLAKLT